MKIVTDTYMDVTTARIYPFLTEDASLRHYPFEGHISVASGIDGEGSVTINAVMSNLTVGQTLDLIDALQKAVEIAQAQEIRE